MYELEPTADVFVASEHQLYLVEQASSAGRWSEAEEAARTYWTGSVMEGHMEAIAPRGLRVLGIIEERELTRPMIVEQGRQWARARADDRLRRR